MQGKGWRLVCFDLDGTLVRGTSVSQHLADRLGHGALLAELERRYAAQEITNATVADCQAKKFAGRGRREMMTHLESIPRIGGIEATLARLRSTGIDSLLCTVTWRFAAQCFQERYGFAAVSGTEIEEGPDGRFTGKVARYFDKYDKREFVVEYCRHQGIPLSTCIAVGDSHSDVPMFGSVGFSVALNATANAKAAASVSVNSDSLIDIFSVIPGF
jgi:phosphoserine phosphatase